MGALAEAFVAYAQPLIDQTDGSIEQMNKAMSISQFCYSLALFPDDARAKALDEMQRTLKMDDEEFAEFQRTVIIPMLRRHEEMFPLMHRRGPISLAQSPSTVAQGPPTIQSHSRKASPGEKYPGTDRYAPCPCGSGQKYKFCCGRKGR